MQKDLNSAFLSACRQAVVMPVLTIGSVEQSVALANALVQGGLAFIEVTLRTPASLAAIGEIARKVKGATVGAGTVLSSAQAKRAVEAGAQFLVSPGATPALLDAADEFGVPFLPGVATASEAMACLERGYRFLKFFPAEQSGGVAALKALAAPLQDLRFCPTGGVGATNLSAYLACPNVVCVGGSWVAPQALIDAGDWDGIQGLASAARALGPL